MIASDLNNPEFSGATNPDARLACRFYSRPVKMDFQSQEAGRPIFKDVDYVQIFVPGDSTSILDTPAREDHKKRFPIQWAQYLNEKSDGEVQGTLLRDWPLLTSAQATELKHFKFYTVEQVANASDQQISSIGMLLGMSPFSFRDKAKAYLSNAKDSALVQAQTDELRKRDQEIADLKAQMEQMMRQMAEQPKRGRPRKDEEQEAA